MKRIFPALLFFTIFLAIALSGCIQRSYCGNGICETMGVPPETPANCPQDCGPTSGSLEVTVVSSFIGGDPLEGAEVKIGLQGALSGETKWTNSDGIALFESVSPGAYKITASKEGYLPKDANAEVVAEQTTRVRIKLPFHPVIPGYSCGDGQCTYPENEYNCQADCGQAPECITESNTGTNGKDECCEGLSQINNCYLSGETMSGETEGWSQINNCYCAIDRFVCSYCGNSECGLGENQCNCSKDCRVGLNCYDLGGQIIYDDYSSTYTDERGFWKYTRANFYVCDGNVVDSADGNCCIGELNSYFNDAGSFSEVKVNAPFKISLNIYDQMPIMRAEYSDETSETFDCAVQEGFDNCWAVLKPQFFSTTGTKTTKLYFESGPIKGKSFEVTTEVITEAEFADLCEQRRDAPIEMAIVSRDDEQQYPKQFYSSDSFSTVSFGDETYFIDWAVAEQYLKINPNASLEELHYASVENSYIVELQEEPSLQKYYEEFAGRLEKLLEQYGANSYLYKQLKSQADKAVVAYATEIERNQQKMVSQLETLGVEINNRYMHSFNGFLIKIPEGKTAEVFSSLQKNPNVKRIYPNMKVQATLDESVPMINADKVWAAFGAKGDGVKIGIIDTGVDYTHPDIGGCLGTGCKVKGGYDFVNYDNDPMDDMGHGTHVAGIAASDGALKGVAPKASVYAIKVLDSSGSGTWDTVIAGIDWAIDPNGDKDISDHLDVINLSLGGWGNPDDPVSKAIDRAFDAGIVPVVAAGNSYGYRTIGSPGTARKALTVGAALNENTIADFSSKGPVLFGNEMLLKPEVSAPGVSICSSQYDDAWSSNQCLDDEHTAISGTSMATPHIAGVAALLKQIHPDWSNSQIKSAIVNTAREMQYANIFAQGSGLVDSLNAANAVLLMEPAVANLGFFSEHNEIVVEIENVSNISQGISVSTIVDFKRMSLSETTDETVELQAALSKNCIAPGEKANLSISVASPNVKYGMYAANLPISSTPNCSGEAEAGQKLPVSFARMKVVQLDLNRNPESDLPEDKIYNAQYVYLFNSEGTYIDSTYYFGYLEDAPEALPGLIIPSDENDFVLIYGSVYDSDRWIKKSFILGAKDIEIESNSITVEVDEHSVDEIENSFPSYLESKDLQNSVLGIRISTQMGEKKFALQNVFGDEGSECTMLSKEYSIHRLSAFDRESEFYLMNQAVPTGFSFVTTPSFYLLLDEAKYPSADLSFDVNLERLKNTEVILHNSISTVPFPSVGFMYYHKSDTGIGASSVGMMSGKRQVFYISHPEFGIWMPSNYFVNETDPVLQRINRAPYVDYSMDLFNGKTRDEFDSGHWSDIPTGDMPEPIEFMKEPISFGWLNQDSGYLWPTLRNAYRNAKFSEQIFNLYTQEEVAPKKKGKITVTTPSGSKVSGNGIQFWLNCQANEPFAWPKLYPCEEGEYIIHVDTEDLFREGRYTGDYNARWTGYYWDYFNPETPTPPSGGDGGGG